MTILYVYLFIVFLAFIIVFYLLATQKEPLWKGHLVNPQQIPETKAMVEEGVSPSEPWDMKSIKNEFDEVKNSIHQLEDSQVKPSRTESLQGFLSYADYSWRLMLKEKEIFTFALLQWAVIGIGYYLWVQMLKWIPPEVWKSTEHSGSGSIADYVLFAWSFVCVGLVAYPLGIFTSCMGAVHFINRQGRRSTIAECFSIVLPKVWSIWVFTWVDSWITVNQILDRLPKKNDRTTPEQRALKEALYYAWKIGTIGILPALITGRGLVESCRESVSVVRHKFKEAAKLRMGYAALCWVVGISAYVGIAFCVAISPQFMSFGGEEIYSHVYTFYFWAGIPLLIAVSIVQVILRPLYVISACQIYSDYLNEREEKIMLPRAPSKSVSAFVAFCVLALIVLVVFMYRDQLGITRMLSTKYGEVFHF